MSVKIHTFQTSAMQYKEIHKNKATFSSCCTSQCFMEKLSLSVDNCCIQLSVSCAIMYSKCKYPDKEIYVMTVK